MFEEIFKALLPDFLYTVVSIVVGTSTIWLPIFLVCIFASIWLKYVRTKALIKSGGILLEIKLPRDVFKSPAAMEVILSSLYQGGNSKNFMETFLDGKMRPWFSLELVSIEGALHFYIWTQPKFRQLIESQFYSQYPGVEIYEAEDYTRKVFLDPKEMGLWGTTFKKKKADVYPIKTYVDYGLDREQEEESKVDPMTSILEFLGSLKAGEQVWIQILIQAHRKMTVKDDAVFPPRPDWRKAAETEIKEKIEKISGAGDDDEGPRRALTPGEKETIAALERSLTKLPFEVGIRGFYIARKGSFDSIGITGLIGSFRQYSSQTLNEIKLGKFTDYDYAWSDFRRQDRTSLEKKMLNAYKLRSYFQIPYQHVLKTKPFIMTTEELATVFHLPGKVLGTPTLTKIPSRKSEPPANLPI